MWDFSSLTRAQTHIPCIGRQILNHWSTREDPRIVDKDSVSTCEMCQKAVLPFHLGHSIFDTGCFMKKLGLSQVTWCYPLLLQTASFCRHLSASECLLCKFLKSKKMVSHLARVLCSSAFPGVRISSESHMALPVGGGHGGGPCPSEEQTGLWSSEGSHVFFFLVN